jgi:hypothetical protein
MEEKKLAISSQSKKAILGEKLSYHWSKKSPFLKE